MVVRHSAAAVAQQRSIKELSPPTTASVCVKNTCPEVGQRQNAVTYDGTVDAAVLPHPNPDPWRDLPAASQKALARLEFAAAGDQRRVSWEPTQAPLRSRPADLGP
jgi:hypothetical protein